MPVGNWNVEWLNLNSQRRYPLAEEATGIDLTDTFNLPNDFLVEMNFPTNAEIAASPTTFFIKHLSAYAGGFAITIGKARFYFTPGVPRELRRMLEHEILPRLLAVSGTQTVIRINYRYNWQTDLVGNPPSKLAAFQVGLSTYF